MVVSFYTASSCDPGSLFVVVPSPVWFGVLPHGVGSPKPHPPPRLEDAVSFTNVTLKQYTSFRLTFCHSERSYTNRLSCHGGKRS